MIFPFLAWLAPITSALLLILLWNLGELGWRSLSVLFCWFLLAGYLQLFAGSDTVGAAGLSLQTMLAVYLILRWRLSSLP